MDRATLNFIFMRLIILVLIRFTAGYLGRCENIFSVLNVLYLNFHPFSVLSNGKNLPETALKALLYMHICTLLSLKHDWFNI